MKRPPPPPPRLVAIGCSLGGVRALQIILGALPRTYRHPVVVTQHRGREGEERLSEHLQSAVSITVRDAEDKESLTGGRVYMAPADYHLHVEPGCVALSVDAPVVHARPAIDVMFESAAESYGERVIGVVLTGASHDGARGAARIKRCSGLLVVQDPATAESGVMPRAALAAASADQVLSVEQIAHYLASLA